MVRVAHATAVAAVLVFPSAGFVVAAPLPQEPAATLEFEVASIKRNTSERLSVSGSLPSRDQVRMIAVPVRTLILTAYPTSLNPPEIRGLPSWAESERYDVIARTKPGATREEVRQMWRALLADRLKLQAHYETLPRQVYKLVVARPGRLGPHIKRRAQDCPPPDPGKRAGPPPPEIVAALQRGGPLPEPLQEELQTRCRSIFNFNHTLRAAGVQMSGLFRMVGLDRPVIDTTGLEGFYDVTLTYSRPSLNPPAPDDPPPLFTAVRDQLGLKFEPATVDDEVVIVDHVARPSEN